MRGSDYVPAQNCLVGAAGSAPTLAARAAWGWRGRLLGGSGGVDRAAGVGEPTS